jgi:DNA invertase Pin-like site-specific DNA recombinase
MANGQIIGYIRVSSVGQNTERQLDDKVSGKSRDRPALRDMLKHVRTGDEVFVHSMDRLARNLTDLRQLVTGLNNKGVRVTFKKEGLTFTGEDSAMSKLLLNLMGAFAEFERELIRERQAEGIAIAKASGKYKGRVPVLALASVKDIERRAAAGESKTALAKEYGVSRATIYNVLGA